MQADHDTGLDLPTPIEPPPAASPQRGSLEGLPDDASGEALTSTNSQPMDGYVPPVDGDMPAWFRNRKQRGSKHAEAQTPARKAKRTGRAAGKKQGPVLPAIQLEPQAEDDRPWSAQVRDWLRGWEAWGYYLSFAIHFLAMCTLLFILLDSTPDDGFPGITSSIRDKGLGEDEIVEMVSTPEIVLPQDFEPQTEDVPSETVRVNNMIPAPSAMSIMDGLALKLPSGGKMVTKGSFSVWSIPEDPEPGQLYKIVIQIKLPPKTTRYPVNDLSGIVEGTDGYTQRLPIEPSRPGYSQHFDGRRLMIISRSDELRVRDDKVQFMITVPGAKRELIKDTITVRSKMLEEEQVLELVF